MPYLQVASSSMNAAFGPDNLPSLGPEHAENFLPNSGVSLSEALARTPNTNLSDDVLAYIDSWPSALRAGIAAVIYDNLTRDARVPITFAWRPGYDFSIEVHDVTDTATSHGGITVILTSRYPTDTHPLGTTAS